MTELITSDKDGIYCPAGDFHIDPWGKVKRAVITHAHSDHLRPGSKVYYCSKKSENLVNHRLSAYENNYQIISKNYDETFEINGVTLSFHPAGHILGSSQIRIEFNNEVAILTGDYKTQMDPTCEPYVQLKGDIFVSEATFGLPIYKWKPATDVISDIWKWIENNKSEGRTSKFFGYSLGKTQRLMAELNQFIDEPIYIHGALHEITEIYRDLGISLPDTELVVNQEKNFDFSDKIVISPPSSFRSNYMKRFKSFNSAMTSGWARVRGRRRMGGYDTGFVLSDHADFPSLVESVKRSQANRILIGFTKSPAFVKYISEVVGIRCEQLSVQYSGDQ